MGKSLDGGAGRGGGGKEGKEDFAHEDPKMEKRSGWAPGSALDFHKPNCEQMEGIGEGVPRLGWVEGEDLRSRDLLRPGKSSTPASAASSRENGDYQGSQELDSEGDTSRKSRGEGWGVGGCKEAKRKEPQPGPSPPPSRRPPPPRDSAKKSGRGQTRGESYHQIG